VLRVYCDRLDPTSIDDLRAAIQTGRYPWFRVEFEAAVRFDGFTIEAWCAAVGTTPSTLTRYACGSTTRPIIDQQRVVWERLFSRTPFPGPPAPGSRPGQPASNSRPRRLGEPLSTIADRVRGPFARGALDEERNRLNDARRRQPTRTR
jgi:hypothetical protein